MSICATSLCSCMRKISQINNGIEKRVMIRIHNLSTMTNGGNNVHFTPGENLFYTSKRKRMYMPTLHQSNQKQLRLGIFSPKKNSSSLNQQTQFTQPVQDKKPTTINSSKPMVTYHKRPLPSKLISLSSIEGKKLFREALAAGHMESYFPLAEQFITQSDPSFCSLTSLAMVMNALNIDIKRVWKGAWRWISEEMLQCESQSVCGHSIEKVKASGLSFLEFESLARCHGVKISSHRPSSKEDDGNDFTKPFATSSSQGCNLCDYESFKEHVVRISSSEKANDFIVVNFSRKYLGQTGDGHFSPIGGFHAEKELVLVMDVARFKYPPFWVKLSDLWESMSVIDKSTGQARGYFILSGWQQQQQKELSNDDLTNQALNDVEITCPPLIRTWNEYSLPNGKQPVSSPQTAGKPCCPHHDHSSHCHGAVVATEFFVITQWFENKSILMLRSIYDFFFYTPGKDKPARWYNIPACYVIDFMKLVTPVVIIIMMWKYEAYNKPSAWAYFGTHGSYGVLWASKNIFDFGDEQFHQPISVFYAMQAFTMLGIYWIPIYLICSEPSNPPAWVIGVSVFLYGLGVFWHFSSDIHKKVFLEFRKALKAELGNDTKLVDNVLKTKLWAVSRNPNYFGELCIYLSFCIMSYHWLPFITFSMIVFGLWADLMSKKDKSLSRHGKEYEDYKKRSALIIPYIF